MGPTDAWSRPLRNLRISVTDRCNLRCGYCMPEPDYVWIPREDVLRFEEISALVDVFTGLGVDRVRLTGGEPLLRRELPVLVKMLARKPPLRDLALTTNGILLAENARALLDAGLGRITVSLDSLRPDRFEALTRRRSLERVLAGIDAALEAGFEGLKIDTVVLRGINDDELVELLKYGRQVGAEVRFIEYMDVGGATRWSAERVVTREQMLRQLEERYGPVTPVPEENSAPADRFRLPDGTVFGIVSSMTQPFCRSCDRARLTADGMWYLCLYARVGTDLRHLVRGGASEREIHDRIAQAWRDRSDRGAEERVARAGRARTLGRDELRRDPHLEMHTRGG